MIIVEQDALGSLELSFKYYPDYIIRAKELGGSFDPVTKKWIIPLDKFQDLKTVFEGELFFKTPEWEITGESAPDYSTMYTFDNDCDVNALGFKLKPFTYQEFGIRFLTDRLKNHGMAFIADDVGLGKTIQAIGALKHLYDEKLIKRLVIVCKKSLKYQWKEEIEKFVDINADIYIADDNKKKRHKAYSDIEANPGNTILIINYHLLMNDADMINADMTIYDEVHVAKKKDGEINKGCRKVTKNSKYCLFMTGTPIMSSPDDMYGIISIKDKKYFGTYKEFKNRYITEYFNGRFKNVVGYKNLDELRDKVQQIILRRTASEVTIDLPDVVEIDKYCDIDDIQTAGLAMAEEKTAQTESKIDLLKKKLKEPGSDTTKLYEDIAKLESSLKGFIAVEQAIANSPVLFHYSKSRGTKEAYKDVTPDKKYLSSKMQMLCDIVEEIRDSGKKVIIFTKYETVAKYASDLLKKYGIGSVVYTGSMNDELRNDSVQAFKNDPDTTAIIGTDALAEGVDTLALVS